MADRRSRGKAGSPVPGKEAYERLKLLRQEVGMSMPGISKATGVSRSVLTTLWSAQGNRNIYPITHESIMSYVPPRGLAYPKEGYTDARGSRRRIQALAVLGYSFSEQARRAGIPEKAFREIENHQAIEVGSAEKVSAMYAQLWNTPYKATTHVERIGRAKAINRAHRLGYKPGAFWDDMDTQEVTSDGF